MRKEILLCPPTQYEVVYQINPWMDITKPVDKPKALREYKALKAVYEELGVKVHEIPQQKGLPDMIYAANYGHPIKYDEATKRKTGKEGLFIKANFKHDERKGEAELAKYYFAGKGFEIAELPENITWEGQGDLLKVGDIYVYGHGKRSDREAKGPIADLLRVREKDILDLEMIDPKFYHVDTAIGPLDDPNQRTVVINQKAFGDEDVQKIKRKMDVVIETNDQDNNVLAGNLVSIGNKVVLAQGISDELKRKFDKIDVEPIEVFMTESLKGGGSVKCNTLEYDKR